MPEILVQCKTGTLTPDMRSNLKDLLKRACARIFEFDSDWGMERALAMFTVVFPIYEPESDLTHDVIVRVPMPRDAGVSARSSHATALPSHISELVNSAEGSAGRPLTVGVAFGMFDVIWYETAELSTS
jgi:hypothetical protein